ncbi:LytTR family DNA-binding domain-containing protein [Lysobacter sp. Root690]|uniref:LytR/AlgR family response regulator transcription factor n=1 Tax=Lysobacter sp. Root690 TaxID=1736588 RepID=UPI0007008BE1|nr:LytTR family DNA-binding domain-containing protein [Lysobacter sp. Root690]KRB11452.1 two-component system response regulator [Lysobacter sp. Root690]
MIRVVVIDDEPLARSGVIVRLARQADVAVVGEYGDGAAALSGLRELRPDLVFIDVRMPGLSGLDVLAALPAHERPMAILLTAYESFAVRAFELRAVDYLLKPIDDERFAEALDRARQALAWRTSMPPAPAAAEPNAPSRWLTRFCVRVGRKTVYLAASEVEWIEADGDYATLHAGDKTHLLRESLQRLCERLDPALFMRVHRSAIVRIDCVTELQPLANRDAMLRLRSGTPLRASRTYIEPLLGRLRGEPDPES